MVLQELNGLHHRVQTMHAAALKAEHHHRWRVVAGVVGVAVLDAFAPALRPIGAPAALNLFEGVLFGSVLYLTLHSCVRFGVWRERHARSHVDLEIVEMMQLRGRAPDALPQSNVDDEGRA